MNRLRFEKSPYLLQHKDNPVSWYAWGDEAFRAARELNLPIFLSIGYSTCYWCHVMEKESFEDLEVAEVLNESFISIKLDREERPDIDQIYMDAVVGITGHGGWPMSVFLTPDLKPFFGGTYFPKKQFIPLLAKIAEVWGEDMQTLLDSAEQLFGFISTRASAETAAVETKSLFQSAREYFQKSFDHECGGFGAAPKFPQPSNISFLYRLARRLNDEQSRKMASQTVEAICRGGIQDQLGGGFHRYAVDRNWLVPHFEKMLYDNAQLASTLAWASRAERKPELLQIAKRTLDYCISALQQPNGGFFAAEDAGEVGREGEFYVWEYRELKEVLTTEEFLAFLKVYPVTPEGNFENGTHVLSFAGDFQAEESLRPLKDKLLAVRNSRRHPFKDSKIITSWNGLMISALAQVAMLASEDLYASAAKKAADFLIENLFEEEVLKRRYCDGEASFAGVLEDYSFFIEGLLLLHEATGVNRYFTTAKNLQSLQDRYFWDEKNGGYFFASGTSSDLITRKKDFNDGATPSGNSVSALNLLRLFQLTGESAYLDRFQKLKAVMIPHVAKFPGAYATFLSALDYELESLTSIVITGPDKKTEEAITALRQQFLPNTPIYRGNEAGPALVTGKEDSNLKIFICDVQGCRLPLESIEQAQLQLKPTILESI